MGFIRFFLAVCVLATHTGSLLGIRWMPGLNAVVVFFVISGFYMSLILNEKYTGEKSNYYLFISNRLLRLLPIYWTVLIVHFLLCLIGYVWINDALTLQIYFDHADEIPAVGWIVFIFCNLFILGMDALYYVHLVSSQGLIWSVKEGLPTQWFMLIIQAWTLSIELLFYFIAPFILRKQKRIIILTVLFLLVIIFCQVKNLALANLCKNFFMPYLIYFLLGAFAWLIYCKIKNRVSITICKIIFGLYLGALFIFPYFYSESELQVQSFYVLTFLAIPFIFCLTKNWKWDSLIGEYSYPIYLSHIMVNDLLKLSGLEKAQNAELNLLITVLVSYILIRFIANPIENFRLHRVQNSFTKR